MSFSTLRCLVENADADDERLKAELVTSNVSPTVASVCDRTSYTAGSEHIFLKNDGTNLDYFLLL